MKQAASDAKESVPSLPSAPSIGLPKVNLPKVTPTVFSDSGDIDPRAVALPGQHFLQPICKTGIVQKVVLLLQHTHMVLGGMLTSLLGGTDCLDGTQVLF